jgi:hypothetical protein
MCPACMATVALLIGSAFSSGGVAAVVVTKLLRPKGEKSLANGRSGKYKRRKDGSDARASESDAAFV